MSIRVENINKLNSYIYTTEWLTFISDFLATVFCLVMIYESSSDNFVFNVGFAVWTVFFYNM